MTQSNEHLTSRPVLAAGDQADRARLLASLHRPGDPLLLANAWDVASAVTVEAAGGQAIGTTSAGVAWSLGVPDAADLGAQRSARVVGRIAAAVRVPVTADIEAGYGPRPADVAASVTYVLRAGAVGVNIEDRTGNRDQPLFGVAAQAGRLAAARAAARRLGVPAWINARTDLFLTGGGASPDLMPSDLMPAAIRRAQAYARAGADSIFVPGLIDTALIAQLAEGPLPVAVMVWPGAPVVAELAAAGVARISLGSAIAQAAYALAGRAAAELLGPGTYESCAGGIGYDELNEALARSRG